MNYSFHPEAEIELNFAVDYYEECKVGLGAEFAYEVQKTIQRVLEYPTAWQKIDEDIRRCLTNRFPFGIIYYQKDNEVIVLAVMQLQREPHYWKERYNKSLERNI